MRLVRRGGVGRGQAARRAPRSLARRWHYDPAVGAVNAAGNPAVKANDEIKVAVYAVSSGAAQPALAAAPPRSPPAD